MAFDPFQPYPTRQSHTITNRAMTCSYNVCKVLVESGADVKQKNNMRKTPLDLAEKRDKNLSAALRRWHSEFCEWEKKRAQEDAGKRPLRSSPSSNNINGTLRSAAQVTSGDTLPTGTWEELQRMVLDARAEVRRMQMEYDKQNQILLEREGRLTQREKYQGQIVAQADLMRRQLAEKEMELAQANSRLLADQQELKRRIEAVEYQTLSVPVVSANQIEWKKKVGAGAFAEVWQGYWRGSHVAIKRFFPPGEGYNTQVSASDLHDMFLRELRFMTRNPHRNIVSVLAANVDPNNRLIIMEYCKKGDLFAHLHSGTDIPHSTRMRWALETARAINHLHDSEPTLIHRDIKTSNMLLDDRGVLKLTDFGFCTAVGDRDFSYTQHQLISKATRGTPAYMAPEQIKGEGYSTKSDVFSFGTVLWELWTRRIPWDGRDPTNILAELSIGSRLPIQENQFPAGVPLLIQRCWLEDPMDRPDMLEVINTLRDIKRATLGKPPARPLKRTNTSEPVIAAATSPPPQQRAFVAGTKPQNILPTQPGLLSPRNRGPGTPRAGTDDSPSSIIPAPSPIAARAEVVPFAASVIQTTTQQMQQFLSPQQYQQQQPPLQPASSLAAPPQSSPVQQQSPKLVAVHEQQAEIQQQLSQPAAQSQAVIQSPTPVYFVPVSRPGVNPILPAAAVEPLRSQQQRISEILDNQRKLLQSAHLSPEAQQHIQTELNKRQSQLIVVQEQLLHRRPTIRPIVPKLPQSQPLVTVQPDDRSDSPPPPPPPDEEDEPDAASPRQIYLAAREHAISPPPDPHVLHLQQQRQQQRQQLIQQVVSYEQQLLSAASPGQPVTPPPPSHPPLPIQQPSLSETAPIGQNSSAVPTAPPTTADEDDPWGMLEALLDCAPSTSTSTAVTQRTETASTDLPQLETTVSAIAQPVPSGPNEAQQYQYNAQQLDTAWQDWQYYAYQGLTAEQAQQQYQQYYGHPH